MSEVTAIQFFDTQVGFLDSKHTYDVAVCEVPQESDEKPDSRPSVLISGISGQQHVPGTDEYEKSKQQYATSTYGSERDMNPALIIQPKNKRDIAIALEYAKAHKIAVAVKSGGHQYSGASSTGGPNIQLDLRNTFKSSEDRAIFQEGSETLIRTSVSWSLSEFNAWLGDNKVFVPHGQCAEVCIGGHVQTGGYGQLARSFGLLGDHVVSLEIIDTDGNFNEVTKATNPDLFWAILGGSPGNLGILTHVTMKVHRDEDYKGARGMRAIYSYDSKTLKRLLEILVEMSDNENCPQNYDICISVLSASFQPMAEFPDLVYPRCIVVYAQWVPLSPTDVCDVAWFDRLKEGADCTLGEKPVEEKPMSKLSADWIFRNAREFEHPYVKRTYTTNSHNLSKSGWIDWVISRFDAIVKPEGNKLWLSAQLQYFGGNNSKIAQNSGNGTAYSWRDTTLACTMDCFYEESSKQQAEDWQMTNDQEALGPSGVFSQEDRRWLWGSWGTWDLDSVWNCYFEDQAKYDRLRQLRKSADPHGTFTPNTFCVKRAE